MTVSGVGRLIPARIVSSVVLPAPLGPMQATTLTGARLERHVVQRLVCAVALVQPDRFEHHGRLRLHAARLTGEVTVASPR